MANFYDLEAERMLLSTIMANNKLLLECSVNDEDFYLQKHRAIYRAYLDMSKNNIPIELVTLSDYFGDNIVDAGGALYVTQVAGTCIIGSSISQYERIIKEKSIRRRTAALCKEVYELCKSDSTVNEIMGALQGGLLTIESNNRESIVHISKLIPDVIKDIEYSIDNKGKILYSTGLRDLDKFTGGWGAGDLIIVAGRPGQGKSALTKNFIDGVCGKGEAVGVFSLEMSPGQLTKRHISDHSMVSIENMVAGDRIRELMPKILLSANKLSELNIYMVQGNVFNINKIALLSRHLKYKFDVKLIVIDYLQLIGGKQASKEEEMADISRTLKILARELDIPIVCLSQLNRECEKRVDKRPLLSDLRSSGAIEQDADIVIFLYRDDYYFPDTDKKDVLEVAVAKARDCPTGVAELNFLKQYQLILDKKRYAYE